MAFIDHDELISQLLKSYLQLIEGYIIERKMVNKKLKLLKEDKKSDPDVIARLENLIIDIDNRKAIAMTTANRLKVMNLVPAAMFRDPKFDAFSHYKVAWEKQRAAQAAAMPHKKGK